VKIDGTSSFKVSSVCFILSLFCDTNVVRNFGLTNYLLKKIKNVFHIPKKQIQEVNEPYGTKSN